MALTQIIDTWYQADGTLFNGTLVITPQPNTSGGIVYSDVQSVSQSSVTQQVQNGLVNFALLANDIAQPSGTTYSVLVYAGRQVSWTETWTVPSSTIPVALAAVRGLAQSLRRAAFFPTSSSWLLPASVYGTAANIPLILTYDQNGNQILGQITRNLTTGDMTVAWAVPQVGAAEVLLSPLQYSQAFVLGSPLESITITNTTAGLKNLMGIVLMDTTGLYIFGGVDITFSLVAASPSLSQANAAAAAGVGGMTPFGANFAGAFRSVTLSFVAPQSGTIVLLGS